MKFMEVVTNHSSLSSELQEKRGQWTWVFISNVLNRVGEATL